MKEIFKSGYGYDKYILNSKAEDVGWSSLEEYENRLDRHFSLNNITRFSTKDILYVIPKKTFEFIEENKRVAESFISYAPPIEGFSESDFINFIESYPKDHYFVNNYRTTLKVKANKTGRTNHDHVWNELLDDFFSPSYTRTGEKVENSRGRDYAIFRLIELNEFYHKSNKGESLKQYLLRDSRNVEKYCKDLLLERYSKVSSDLTYSWLRYADFNDSEIYNLIININSSQLEILIEELTEFVKKSHVEAKTFLDNNFNLLVFKALNKILEFDSNINESNLSSAALLKALISKSDFNDYMKEKDYDAKVLSLISDQMKKL